jgi:hypothetical protein
MRFRRPAQPAPRSPPTSPPPTPLAPRRQAAGLAREDWFLRRGSRAAAADAAAAAAAAGAPQGPALAPFVDGERIEWLAALDADSIRFAAELHEGGYGPDVLIK